MNFNFIVKAGEQLHCDTYHNVVFIEVATSAAFPERPRRKWVERLRADSRNASEWNRS